MTTRITLCSSCERPTGYQWNTDNMDDMPTTNEQLYCKECLMVLHTEAPAVRDDEPDDEAPLMEDMDEENIFARRDYEPAVTIPPDDDFETILRRERDRQREQRARARVQRQANRRRRITFLDRYGVAAGWEYWHTCTCSECRDRRLREFGDAAPLEGNE